MSIGVITLKNNLGYQSLKDHVFEEINIDQLFSIIGSSNAVPVYFAFDSCPWCKEYISYLNEVAIECGIDKIYYFNPKEIRTYYFDQSMDQIVLNEYFDRLIKIIGVENVSQKILCDIDNLEDICDNKKVFSWIYVPILYIFQDGEVLGSYIGPNDHEKVDGILPPMNEEQKEELKKNYRSLLALV